METSWLHTISQNGLVSILTAGTLIASGDFSFSEERERRNEEKENERKRNVAASIFVDLRTTEFVEIDRLIKHR